jgi:predicted metal-binding membrane protein
MDMGGTVDLAAGEPEERAMRARRRARVAVAVFVAVAAGLGWAWLGAMVVAMLSGTDMAALGPGMGIFNRLNGFAGLSPEMRAGLAMLCAPVTSSWAMTDWVTVFAMWMAMVAAMMLPTAVPVLMAHADLGATRAARGERVVSPIVLGLGYLAVWTSFALVATAAQGILTQARLLTPAGLPASLVLAGTTLIAAGIYQFSPLKAGCLVRCRSPRVVFAESWSDRVGGVFRQGIEQGIDCLGCCWALMVVMFAVGVMNVVWIAVLGAVMVWEKLSSSPWVSRGIGVILIVWGAVMIANSPVGAALLARLI